MDKFGSKISRRLRVLFLGVLVAAFGLFALAGCAASQAGSDSPSADSPTASSAADNIVVSVASMKGATSIGLAAMMQDNPANYDFQIYTAADEIVPLLSSGDVDIALIPANLAATLYQKTDGAIQVIDINTLGVLYAVTANSEMQAVENFSMANLAGSTVYMTGKGTVPEYTVRALIAAAGLEEDAVTLEFRSEPTEVVALLQEEPNAVGILPQPFVTAALAQNSSLATVMDLTEQWDALTALDSGLPDGGRMITGVTVARTAFIEENPQAVVNFLQDHLASTELVNSDPATVAPEVVDLGIVGSGAVAEDAIPACNIVCITGDAMKTALAGYLEALYQLEPSSIGGVPAPDGLYYVI